MKYDINTIDNFVMGRQGWAYVCNSGEFPVIDVDLDLPQKYENYLVYSKVRVAWDYNGHELFKTCTVANDKGDDGTKDKWELTSGGSCLSASFTHADAIELMEDARLPKVRKNQPIAVVTHNERVVLLSLVKITHVDVNCMTVAVLEPLTEDEMKEFLVKANKWLNR